MKATDSQFAKQFKAARRVSTPLLAVTTPDPAEAMRLMAALAGKDSAIFSWDIISGLRAANKLGKDKIADIVGDQDPALLNNPAEALDKARLLPPKGMLFVMNAHRYLDASVSGAAVAQAIWNLRDEYKTDERTLVLLCPGISLPQELTQDVTVLDEPLPDSDTLATLITKLHKDAGVAEPDAKVLERAVDATRGLSAFTAEQATAMSLTKEGIDLDALWERKRKTVEQTPGLGIWRGGETYADVRGVANIKNFLSKLFSGKEPPSVLVFMDEIEKMFAGTAGDLSGVTQEMHGEFLSWMQDKNVLGMMLVGHPGCTKSHITKATGGEFKVPTVVLNMSALKGSLVGQSGQQLRSALKVIEAIGRPLVMATSNSLANLPPELRRRFQLGTFFFDLPSKVERSAVWDLYTKKYNLKDVSIPKDEGWTPAEIRTCCDLAWRLNSSPFEVADYIVPVSKSAPDKIQGLRQQATGKFLSASDAGVYRYEASAASAQPEGEPGRKIRI